MTADSRRLELQSLSSKAVEEMINFMYGKDLKEDLDYDTVQSLVEASEAYGYKAFHEAILKLLNKQCSVWAINLLYFKNVNFDSEGSIYFADN